ncbi:MAG: heavy metal translocating P-type ATPase [Ghiorsea sp.]|nr:heavy metal translocating P-type ATPase [Ghiorsea sp.]
MPSTSAECFHCGLDLPRLGTITTDIQDEQQSFCCNGCAQVCEIIHQSGLNSFYNFAPSSRSWDKPEQAPEDAKLFDLPEIQADFVRQRPDGTYQAELLIEGIHCPACVWLIEQALRQIDAITYAEVSLTRRRLRLRWQPENMKLSEAVLAIGRLGYQAIPYEEDLEQKANKARRQELLFRMAFAGFVFANVMTAAVCLYGGEFFGIEPRWRAVFEWYSMVLTFAGIAYSGRSFFTSAWKAIKTFKPNMDLPISIGITTSFLWSSYATIFPSLANEGHVYFDSVSMFIFLILVGRFLESSARETAGSATRHLLALLPRSARMVLDDGHEDIIPLRSIQKGNILRIKPGDRIPVDGKVLDGHSEVDESIISGESRPLSKQAGSQVIGGTLNISGQLKVQATHLGHESVLSQIVELVEQAQDSKVRIQGIADRIVPWFVTIILGLAAATFIYWYISASFAVAVMTAVTVLIITCPCALGLATPMAISIGGGLGGKLGILIKRGSALEQMLHLDHIVFDKTGTLTRGQLNVQNKQTLVEDKAQLWQKVHALERASEHPLATAITNTLQAYPADDTLADFNNVSGRGVEGYFNNNILRVGSLGWLLSLGITLENDILKTFEHEENQGHTLVAIFDEQQLLAWFSLGDELRPEASAVIRSLQQQGIGVSLLTGDREGSARAIVAQLDILQPIQVIAEVLPNEKADKIKELQAQGLAVGMIGDGVNDAPALTQADVGIAMGQATDISAHAADVVLLGGLDKLPTAFSLSKQTMRTIKQNLAISLGYNILVIPLAVVGMIHPLFAAIAMPASSLLVVGNALLIHKRVKG